MTRIFQTKIREGLTLLSGRKYFNIVESYFHLLEPRSRLSCFLKNNPQCAASLQRSKILPRDFWLGLYS